MPPGIPPGIPMPPGIPPGIPMPPAACWVCSPTMLLLAVTAFSGAGAKAPGVPGFSGVSSGALPAAGKTLGLPEGAAGVGEIVQSAPTSDSRPASVSGAATSISLSSGGT